MFTTIRNKAKDVRTLAELCQAAERIGRSAGEANPGSEHFVLASFELPDGTARQAMESLGVTPQAFDKAIQTQFEESLRYAGVEPAAGSTAGTSAGLPMSPPSALYEAAPSGQTLLQRLASSAPERKTRTLLSADVLLAATEERYSIAARALRALDIAPEKLAQAASSAISAYQRSQDRA